MKIVEAALSSMSKNNFLFKMDVKFGHFMIGAGLYKDWFLS
jgi:hypothetical protein